MKFLVHRVCSGAVLILILSFSLSLQAALMGRDLDGNLANGHEGVYDDVLNITWLADTKLALKEDFGLLGIESYGAMTWDLASDWVDAMAAENYLGYNGWRLPKIEDTGPMGCDLSTTGGTDCGYNVQTFDQAEGVVYSELAYMYYDNFQALGAGNPDGTFNSSETYGITNALDQNNNAFLFFNVSGVGSYWAGAENALSDSEARFFRNLDGLQGVDVKSTPLFAWAVHNGDIGVSVSNVPIPAALWLFGSALLILVRFKI